MNKAIIFDLDGVLVDSKEIHFNALNLALAEWSKEFVITKTEQDHVYEGLTTKSKLQVLTELKGLPRAAHDLIWADKQHFTATLFSSVSKDKELIDLFKMIKDAGIKIGVASNSIRETLDTCLKRLGVYNLVDMSLSNEDVDLPKPSPQIYQKCIHLLVSSKGNVVIYEDSDIGLAAARSSGAKTIQVYNRNDLTISKIQEGINYLDKH